MHIYTQVKNTHNLFTYMFVVLIVLSEAYQANKSKYTNYCLSLINISFNTGKAGAG